jgi:hypothetical protein
VFTYTIEAFCRADRTKGLIEPVWREQVEARNPLAALRLVCSLRGEDLDENSITSTSTIVGAATATDLSLIVTTEKSYDGRASRSTS